MAFYALYLICLAFTFLSCGDNAQQVHQKNSLATKISEIAMPKGFERIAVKPASFGEYLRNLPLSKDNTVYLFNGEKKKRQDVHYAVLRIDVGTSDLQQCADAVMRLRAEYLFEQKRFEHIHFNFTSGHEANYLQWRKGERPQINGNQVTWKKTASMDASYANFRKYMNIVFTYASTRSLVKELKPVAKIANLQIGDVFIQSGSPGHAVLVVDIAIHPLTNEKAFLLAQSYMPAQSIHILLNLEDDKLSPWYVLKPTAKTLLTPEWEFKVSSLKAW